MRAGRNYQCVCVCRSVPVRGRKELSVCVCVSFCSGESRKELSVCVCVCVVTVPGGDIDIVAYPDKRMPCSHCVVVLNRFSWKARVLVPGSHALSLPVSNSFPIHCKPTSPELIPRSQAHSRIPNLIPRSQAHSQIPSSFPDPQPYSRIPNLILQIKCC